MLDGNSAQNSKIGTKKTIKQIIQLLKIIDQDGSLQSIGKFKLLKHNKPELYSRRIAEINRLVYEMSDNNLIIVKSYKGHYEN
ncbi:MAG: type II toxin-antitoxin system YoeB family toxin [Lachnospiraceae bacterium]|nr:type II toxin-antitoxin system YoeB family toxin [Lachnospiraceae bacterium]